MSIRGFIEELLKAELDAALGRDRYERPRLAEQDAAAEARARTERRNIWSGRFEMPWDWRAQPRNK